MIDNYGSINKVHVRNASSDYLLKFVASRPHLYHKFVNSFLEGEFQSLVESLGSPDKVENATAGTLSGAGNVHPSARSKQAAILARRNRTEGPKICGKNHYPCTLALCRLWILSEFLLHLVQKCQIYKMRNDQNERQTP